MVKTTTLERTLTWAISISVTIALVGTTMAIFEIPYGEKIALAGTLWFIASFVLAMLYFAVKMEKEKEEKLEKDLKFLGDAMKTLEKEILP